MMRPPTDNLYKFLAVSGVILVVVGLLLRNSFIMGLIEETTPPENGVTLPNDDETEAMRKAMAEMDPTELERFVKAVSREFEQNIQHARFRARRLGDIRLASYLSIIVGAVVACYGFGLWYHRVQRHLDAILAREASSNAGKPPGG